MIKGLIYVLIDPNTKEIKYVGATKLVLEERLYLHIKDSKSNSKRNFKKKEWIKNLLSENLTPEIKEIDSSNDVEELRLKELYWINYYISNGVKILNEVNNYSNFSEMRYCKKILQYDLEGNFIREFRNVLECAKFFGGYECNSTIYSIACGKGKKYTYKGFFFIYEGDSIEYRLKNRVKKGVHVVPEYHKKYLANEARKRNKRLGKEHFEKMRSLRKTKPIIEIATGREFKTIKEAVEIVGKSRKFFQTHVKNKVKKPLYKYKDIV